MRLWLCIGFGVLVGSTRPGTVGVPQKLQQSLAAASARGTDARFWSLRGLKGLVARSLSVK